MTRARAKAKARGVRRWLRKYGADPSTIPPRKAGLDRKNRETLEWLDRQTPLVRCLVAFYGSSPVGQAMQYANPEDVPRRLGRVSEFEEYWSEWQAAMKPPEDKRAEQRAASVKALSDYFL